MHGPVQRCGIKRVLTDDVMVETGFARRYAQGMMYTYIITWLYGDSLPCMHAWGKPALLHMLILILITTFYLKLTYQEYGNHLLSRARRQVDMGV